MPFSAILAPFPEFFFRRFVQKKQSFGPWGPPPRNGAADRSNWPNNYTPVSFGVFFTLFSGTCQSTPEHCFHSRCQPHRRTALQGEPWETAVLRGRHTPKAKPFPQRGWKQFVGSHNRLQPDVRDTPWRGWPRRRAAGRSGAPRRTRSAGSPCRTGCGASACPLGGQGTSATNVARVNMHRSTDQYLNCVCGRWVGGYVGECCVCASPLPSSFFPLKH